MELPVMRALSWWRRHAGVRVRTALSAAGVVALALAVSGVLLVVLLQRSLGAAVQGAAEVRGTDIAAALAKDGVEGLGGLASSGERSVVQILVAERVLLSSPEITGEPALTTVRPAPGQVVGSTGRVPVGDDDDLHRLVTLGARAPDGQPVVIVVAQSLETVDASIAALTTLLLAGVPVLVVLVGGSTFVLAGRALRPVEAIRRRVAGIGGGDLGQRVPVPPARDEVGRLAVTMNDMLERLEAAAFAQRRFVSDASHELRSPLATVRTSMEVAQAHPELTDWSSLTSVVLEETGRVQTLVADMLLLARSDERGLQLHRGEVDLDDLCAQEVARLRRAGMNVTADIHPVRVLGDPERLARVLRNLGDNAARHADTQITVRLSLSGPEALVEVSDDGAGIPEAMRERVFDRFVRLDESRTRHTGGTGLGLPIVRQIVQAHGGTVRVADRPGPGTAVHVVLPATL